MREASFEEILHAACQQMTLRVAVVLASPAPKRLRDYLPSTGEPEHEVFAVLFLDKRHRLISYKEMFRGTIDGATVHPREVVKEALKQNAAAVSSLTHIRAESQKPSQADEFITTR